MFHEKHHTQHTPLSHGLLVGLDGVLLAQSELDGILTVNVYRIDSGNSPC
jgi:hypothetical protein